MHPGNRLTPYTKGKKSEITASHWTSFSVPDYREEIKQTVTETSCSVLFYTAMRAPCKRQRTKAIQNPLLNSCMCPDKICIAMTDICETAIHLVLYTSNHLFTFTSWRKFTPDQQLVAISEASGEDQTQHLHYSCGLGISIIQPPLPSRFSRDIWNYPKVQIQSKEFKQVNILHIWFLNGGCYWGFQSSIWRWHCKSFFSKRSEW